MRILSKVFLVVFFALSFFLIVDTDVSAVDTPSILKKCNIVINEADCRKAVKDCSNDVCANKAVENKAITGGKVALFCRSTSKPQECQKKYEKDCAGKTRDALTACQAGVLSAVGGSNDAAGGSFDNTQGDLGGDSASFNSKGAKNAKNTCGSGESAVKTQIDLGCRGEGSAIQDLALAIVRLLTYGVGIVLVGSMIYAGITYSASTGNPEATQKAKNRIRDAIIALIFYLLIGALMQFLVPGGFFG